MNSLNNPLNLAVSVLWLPRGVLNLLYAIVIWKCIGDDSGYRVENLVSLIWYMYMKQGLTGDYTLTGDYNLMVQGTLENL